MATTFTLIQTYTLATATASFDFTSIPATYTDLFLKLSYRGTWTGGVGNSVSLSLNGLATNFTSRYLQGAGSGTPSSGTGTQYAGNVTTAAATASTFSSDEIYFTNYAGSTYKSYSVDSVTENNATQAYATFIAGLWSNTAAINRVTITNDIGNFVTYSSASLYGILKA